MQPPDAHPAVAWASEHTFSHVPQLFGLVAVLVSQPFAATPSQFPHPPVHATTVHAESAHPAIAFGRVHAALQEPQLFALLVRLTSQPSVGLRSQSAKPVLHVPMPHVPLLQTDDALASWHTVPQPPQLLTSVDVAISHPSAGLWLQSENPVLQWRMAQVPVGHVGVALFSVQVFPQPPQFAGVSILVSQPFVALPSQSANPGKHAPTVHAPLTQPAEALGTSQTFPHPPHADGLVLRLASQPLSGLWSQLP